MPWFHFRFAGSMFDGASGAESGLSDEASWLMKVSRLEVSAMSRPQSKRQAAEIGANRCLCTPRAGYIELLSAIRSGLKRCEADSYTLPDSFLDKIIERV